MAQGNIDFDRGVVMRSHPTGVTVYMYIDEPGTFRNAFGTEVSDTLAAEAGYDMKSLSKQKLRRERVARAMEAIDADLMEQGVTKKVVVSRAGFNLVDIGLGRYNVEDPDGHSLNPSPLSKEQGKALFEKIVAPEAGVDPYPRPEVPAPAIVPEKAPIPVTEPTPVSTPQPVPVPPKPQIVNVTKASAEKEAAEDKLKTVTVKKPFGGFTRKPASET